MRKREIQGLTGDFLSGNWVTHCRHGSSTPGFEVEFEIRLARDLEVGSFLNFFLRAGGKPRWRIKNEGEVVSFMIFVVADVLV